MYDDYSSPLGVGLVPMSGTVKQVDWARTIRREMLGEVAHLRDLFKSPGIQAKCAKRRAAGAEPDANIVAQVERDMAIGLEILDAAEDAIYGATDARWFIDNRSTPMPLLLHRKAEARINRAHRVDIHAIWDALKW